MSWSTREADTEEAACTAAFTACAPMAATRSRSLELLHADPGRRRARAPRRPACAGRQVVVRRLWQHDEDGQPTVRVARADTVGARIIFCRGMPDGNGFMAGVLGPGGCIYQVDPDGKNWELVSTGYRNEFDAAFNRRRRPVHVRCRHGMGHEHAVVSADARLPGGQRQRVRLAQRRRQVAGLLRGHARPLSMNVGPGSPTGICFGYGAKFPAKYQDALFMCDWSYGKLYAVHLTPEGSCLQGASRRSSSAARRLPLTDVVVNPKDGAVYFTIGGRKTQSGLYRVTYTGKESTDAVRRRPGTRTAERPAAKAGGFSRQAEPEGRRDRLALSGPRRPFHPLRRPCRHRAPGSEGVARAGAEGDRSARAIQALLALVRATGAGSVPPSTQAGRSRPRLGPSGGASSRRSGESTGRSLTDAQRLDLLRVYGVLFNRMGWPERAARAAMIQPVRPALPGEGPGAERRAVPAARLSGGAGHCRQDAEVARSRADAGRADGVCQGAARAENRLDAGAAQELFHVVSQGGDHSREAPASAASCDNMKTRRGRQPDRGKSCCAQADPGSEIGTGRHSVAKARPFVKKWTSSTRLVPVVGEEPDRSATSIMAGDSSARPAVSRCHRFDNEGGSVGPDLTGGLRPIQRPRPARVDHRAEQGHQRPVRRDHHRDHGRQGRDGPDHQFQRRQHDRE